MLAATEGSDRTMTRRTQFVLTLTGLATAAALTACAAPGAANPAPPASSPTLHSCPTTPTSAQQPPTGQGQPALQITSAKTVAPSDISTSTVLTDLTGPQIQCGRVAVDSVTDVVFATPTVNGSPKQLKLDVLVPRTAGPKPLVVYVPGGGFMIAPKSLALDQRTFLAESGFVVASVEYRTVPDGAIWSDGVTDVKSAIRYLRAHAGEYQIDPSHVGVWGESAGGYLVSMVGVTNGMPQFDVGANLDQSSAVQAVLDKFGPSDYSKVAADFDVAAQQANYAPDNNLAKYAGVGAGKSVLDNPQAVAKANPITYVHRGDPPFLLMHGSADTAVSPSQTLILHTALRAAGDDSTRYVLQGAGHGDLAVLSGDASTAKLWTTQSVMNLMAEFLHKQLTSQ
jgi:acetyl esterase/lipase